VGGRFASGELLLERCGPPVRVWRVVVGEMWATGLGRESFCWIDVGHRFEFGVFSLERCGRQIRVRRGQDGCCWIDVGHRFEFGGFSLERCGRQIRVGRVFLLERCRQQVCGLQVWIGSWESWIGRVVVGNLWGTGSDQLSFC
jgi:hypothetical protein